MYELLTAANVNSSRRLRLVLTGVYKKSKNIARNEKSKPVTIDLQKGNEPVLMKLSMEQKKASATPTSQKNWNLTPIKIDWREIPVKFPF